LTVVAKADADAIPLAVGIASEAVAQGGRLVVALVQSGFDEPEQRWFEFPACADRLFSGADVAVVVGNGAAGDGGDGREVRLRHRTAQLDAKPVEAVIESHRHDVCRDVRAGGCGTGCIDVGAAVLGDGARRQNFDVGAAADVVAGTGFERIALVVLGVEF
jgi:hypothetical protein